MLKGRFSDENIDKKFYHFMETFKSRKIEYMYVVEKIYSLVKKQDISSAKEIMWYLRPWDLEVEGNWIGMELIRTIAMQSLCYLGKKDERIKQYILDSPNHTNAELNEYTDHLKDIWAKYTDISCIPVPEEDFIRCLKDVKDCINRTEDEILVSE